MAELAYDQLLADVAMRCETAFRVHQWPLAISLISRWHSLGCSKSLKRGSRMMPAAIEALTFSNLQKHN
jgi:hypothetical protein